MGNMSRQDLEAARSSAGSLDFADVDREERSYISDRRKALGASEADLGDGGTAGLALSGGGIRSAAFCIGAMQALEAFPLSRAQPDRVKEKAPRSRISLFSRFDYLSSVSGGGYAASCVSACLAATGEFPFASKMEADEAPVLRHIRDHSNYLFPRGFANGLGPNLAVILRGFIGHLPFFLTGLLALVLLTVHSNPTFESLDQPDIFGFELANFPDFFGIDVSGLKGSFAVSTITVSLAAALIYGWSLVSSAKSGEALNAQTLQRKVLSWGFIAILIVCFFEFQPFVIKALANVNAKAEPAGSFAALLHQLKSAAAEWSGFFGAGTGSAAAPPSSPSLLETMVAFIQRATLPLTALAGFLAAAKGIFGSGEPGTEPTGIKGYLLSMTNTALVWAAGLAVPLLFWLAYLYLCYWAITPGPVQNVAPTAAQELAHLPPSLSAFANWVSDKQIFTVKPGEALGVTYAYLFTVMSILSLFQSANANSAHILYKERLASAFLVKPEKGSDTKTGMNRLSLKGIGASSNKQTPLHLINAALNIQGSSYANGRGRDADFFTFSQLHTGSEATQWCHTDKAPEEIDQATAMTTSAAAASTAMGSNKIGLLGFTLAFLNVRLGYWLNNPKFWGNAHKQPGSGPLGFFRKSPYRYLVQEIFGQLDAEQRQIYLTDGGHIENLGLYALLKRRCKFIVVIDAEADPEMRFPSFAIAQRYARIDLGVRIDMSTKAVASHALAVRQKLGQTGKPGKDGQIADFPPCDPGPHCAIGRIAYPAADGTSEEGILLYVKSSLSGDENDYMLDYARRYRAFPHETTGDQFFSEEQFECYRALGFHALNGALRCTDKIEFPDAGDPPAPLAAPAKAKASAAISAKQTKLIASLALLLGNLKPQRD